MPSIEDYLASHEFFKGLDSSFISFLAGAVTEIHVEEDDVLFSHGKPADKFYLLREGSISIEIPALVGPPLEVQALGEGKILGWSWLIPPYKWNFLARAKEDSTVLEFDGKAILQHCEADPRFGYDLIKRFAALMSERLDAARQKLMDQWNPPGFA